MKELRLLNRKIVAAILLASYLILLGVGSVHFHHNHLHTDACEVVISQTRTDDSHSGFGGIEHCIVQNVLSNANPALTESNVMLVTCSPELTNVTVQVIAVKSTLPSSNLLRAPPTQLV